MLTLRIGGGYRVAEALVKRWPSAETLIGGIGYGMVLATVYLLFFAAAHGAGDASTDVAGRFPDVVGSVSLAACFVFAQVFSDRLAKMGTHRLLWPATAGLAAFAGSFCLLGDFLARTPFMYAAWAFAGVCTTLLCIAWSNYLCSIEKAAILRSSIVAFVTMGVACLLLAFVDAWTRMLAVVMLVLLSSVFFMAVARNLNVRLYVSKRDSLENLHLDVRSSLSYCFTGLAIGYLVSEMAGSWKGSSGQLATLGVGILGAVLVAALVMKVKDGSFLLLGPVERFTFPLLVVGLLVEPYVGGFAEAACVAVLLSVLFLRDLARIVNRSVLSTEFTVQQCYLYVRATMPVLVGLVAGRLLSFASVAFLPDVAAVSCSILLVVMLSVGITVAPYGADPLTMPTTSADMGVSQEVRSSGLWRAACEKVAEKYELTPRECDVFHMLAHGRNAQVIAREFSLSIYTVKSHAYNIYRKVGVDSQQALIDQVEKEQKSIKKQITEPRGRL